MSIKIGDTTIEKLYLGSTEIEKIYQGDTAIYEGDEPTPPSPTPQYRWVNIDPIEEVICGDSGDECTAYYKQKKQVSYDSGTTWTDVSPAEYQKGDVYEYDSQFCGCEEWIPLSSVTTCDYCIRKLKFIGNASDITGFTTTTFATSPCNTNNTIYWHWRDIENYRVDANTFIIDFEVELGEDECLFGTPGSIFGGQANQYLKRLVSEAEAANVEIYCSGGML